MLQLFKSKFRYSLIGIWSVVIAIAFLLNGRRSEIQSARSFQFLAGALWLTVLGAISLLCSGPLQALVLDPAAQLDRRKGVFLYGIITCAVIAAFCTWKPFV
jgi:hypothetical protein